MPDGPDDNSGLRTQSQSQRLLTLSLSTHMKPSLSVRETAMAEWEKCDVWSFRAGFIASFLIWLYDLLKVSGHVWATFAHLSDVQRRASQALTK